MRIGYVLLFLGLMISGFGQKLDPEKLNKEIFQLNSENNFTESIRILEDIIGSDEYGNYDKYLAYLQKSITYKRLFNYHHALTNLNLAKEYGLKSDRKEEVQVRILAEQIFHAFDFLKFDEVEALVENLDPIQLHLLDNQTHAFLITVFAILELEKGNYQLALKKLDEAIPLLKKSSPADLPNIYRKKIEIYTKTQETELAQLAFDSGMYYANRYEMIVYKIGMNESMKNHFTELKQYERAYHHSRMVDTLKYNYNYHHKSGQLSQLEKEIAANRQNSKLESKQFLTYTLYSIIAIILIITLIVFRLFYINKKKKAEFQLENEQMRNLLESLSNERNEKGEMKLDLSKYELTERQLEIINLVKQGKTNREIGVQLFISENTVKYHLRTIYSILGIENRYDLKMD